MHSLLKQYPHLLSQWYALELSRSLRSGQLLRKTFFDQPVVIFRTSDQTVGALLDRCPHRGVPLSDGQALPGGLRCAYHGWEFDRQGVCTKVPGLCAGRRLPSTSVRSFPICEQGGMIWLSPAMSAPASAPLAGSPPDQMKFSSFFMKAAGSSDLVDALENLLDPTHTHFVHRGLIRSEGSRQRVGVEVHREGDRVEAVYHGEARASGFLSRWWQGTDAVSTGRFVLPSTGELEYRNHRGLIFLLRVFFTPGLGNELHITMAATVRRFPFVPGFLVKAFLLPMLRVALRQDARILARQKWNSDYFPEMAWTYSELDVLRPHIELLLRDGTAQSLQRNIEMEL